MWSVSFDDEFEAEFEALPVEVQDELLAHARVLAQIGPISLIEKADRRFERHLQALYNKER